MEKTVIKIKKDKPMATKNIPKKWNDLGLFLRPIRTKGNYNQAIAILDNLVGRTDLTKDQKDFVESLSALVEVYEEEHEQIKSNNNPIKILKFLLESNNMNGSDLGRLLGNRSLGSLLLTGKRNLSKNHIKILSKHFLVEPGLFL